MTQVYQICFTSRNYRDGDVIIESPEMPKIESGVIIVKEPVDVPEPAYSPPTPPAYMIWPLDLMTSVTINIIDKDQQENNNG